jgi:DNA-directed RNA polymerase specialized sigma24 family protein
VTLSDVLFDNRSNNIDNQIYLLDLMSKLSPIQEQIVKKVFIDGCKTNEASKLLGISDSQIRREIQKIKKSMKSLSKESVLM